MRTLIINAVVLDGTGAPGRREAAVVVQDHLVEAVVDGFAPYYDRADVVVDARGGFVLPGVINHHAHGLTRGPLMIVGEPPLSDARVRANLDRLLGQGVTTALNVDGFATPEEALASSRFHPLMVRVATLHTEAHLAWATEGPFPFGGVQERHRWTLDRMLARGALAIGEAGPGNDAHWADYTLIPGAVARLGHPISVAQARALRLAAESGDRSRVARLLVEAGLDEKSTDDLFAIYAATVAWSHLARRALDEAIASGHRHNLPLILHHTPTTHPMVLDAARQFGNRVIASHSNFQARDPDEAVQRARAVRQRGGLVDIMSGDAFGARQFQASPEVTFRLLADGLVDLISTDYAGGFWDPMLLVVERAHEAGAIALEDGVRLLTSAPADAIPGLAPDRGRIQPEAVADLVVTHPGHLSHVREVLVSGQRVPLPPRLW